MERALDEELVQCGLLARCVLQEVEYQLHPHADVRCSEENAVVADTANVEGVDTCAAG